MIKKLGMIVCFSSALFAVSSAHAEWEPNWLIGVMGGYADRDARFEVNYGHPDPNRQSTTKSPSLDESGFIWGVLAGYQARCNGWLIGGELNVDWRNLDEINSFAFSDALDVGWTGSAKYDQNTVVGLTARLGYEVNCWFLPFARGGFEISNDNLTYTATSTSGLTADVDGSHRQYRFILGVGAEMPIPVCLGLSFRLEYNYISQGKGVSASGFANDNATFVGTNAKVRTNAGKLSLVYNFL